MKFTDGFWMNREGLSLYNAHKVWDYDITDGKVVLYAPHFDVQNRGQTLAGPVLTLTVDSPATDVLRVRAEHFTGRKERGPKFISSENISVAAITVTEGKLEVRSGRTRLVIGLGDTWSFEFYDNDRLLTNSRGKNLGYVTDASGKTWMKEQLAASVGETFYGLGERFTPFVKNGQVVDCRNSDGGTSSEQAYKNVPFYLSSRGYGVLVNDPGAVSFEICSEKVSRVQFSVPGESLEYFFFNGPTPALALSRYTEFTGLPALPPAWSFGLWLTTSFTTKYDEATVDLFLQGMADRRIPLSVFHFDCFWMREYHWTDFDWDTRQFPDPSSYLAKLKARGLKICVWINPYIAQRSRLFDEGMKNGYLLKTDTGDVWQTDAWQPGMGIVDFTNPGARAWFAENLSRLVDMGVDSFKTDFGERIPEAGVKWHDDSDPVRMRNYYSFLYNKTVFGLLEKKMGRGNALVFARSGTAGSQMFPVHWGGDCTAAYESMAESLRGGLSLCLSGFSFWSHDISGFELTATPDIYKRWTAFGLLSTHSRLHGNSSYRVPWLFDEEAVDVLRFFVNLKCALMPYIWRAAVESSRIGVPVMRAMLLEFPDDPSCRTLDRQYMLGDSLLVAPILDASGAVEYYPPAGKWLNLLSGELVTGGAWRNETHGYFSLPLLVRPASLLAFGDKTDTTDYDYADGVDFFAYALNEGIEKSLAVLRTDGKVSVALKVTKRGESYSVESSGADKCWTLRIAEIAADGSLRCFAFAPKNINGSFEFACDTASSVPYAPPVRV